MFERWCGGAQLRAARGRTIFVGWDCIDYADSIIGGLASRYLRITLANDIDLRHTSGRRINCFIPNFSL